MIESINACDLIPVPKGEYIIMHRTVRMKGEEVKTKSGLIIGVEQHGEVPLTATVVSVGPDVNQNEIKVGDVVLIPNSHLINVPDPRIVLGLMDQNDPQRLTMFTTHYKNIVIVYSKPNENEAV